MTTTALKRVRVSSRNGLDFLALLAEWRRRRRYRAELRRLLSTGPHLIKDIGLAMSDVEREAFSPFWR